MPIFRQFRKTLSLPVASLAFLFVFSITPAYSSEPRPSDPFTGKYSTTYPFGEKRTFDSLGDLFRFLKDPKSGVNILKKDEFESDADFAKRLQAFEAKFAVAQDHGDRSFSIEFKVTLGTYSHVLHGFPMNLSIYDYKGTNLYNERDDIVFKSNIPSKIPRKRPHV